MVYLMISHRNNLQLQWIINTRQYKETGSTNSVQSSLKSHLFLYLKHVTFKCSIYLKHVTFKCPIYLKHLTFKCPIYLKHVNFKCPIYLKQVNFKCPIYLKHVNFKCPMYLKHVTFKRPIKRVNLRRWVLYTLNFIERIYKKT